MASEDALALPALRWKERGWLVQAGAAVLLLFGAHMSFAYSRGLWRADPDVAVPYALWQGLQRYGWDFLRTWAYSPDNWLFSLAPLDWALISILPGRPVLVVLTGWMFFLASVALAGLLLGRLCGQRAGWTLAAVLSFAGYAALGEAGFLTYPITHNSSMLWGLLALWLACLALTRPSRLSAGLFIAAAGLCLTLDTLSDPWAGAAVALPVALAAAGVGARRRSEPAGRRAIALAGVAILAFAAARTHIFGLFGFLPDSPLAFTDASGVVANAGWAFRALGTMADIAPGWSTNSPLAIVPSGLAFLGVLGWGMLGAIRDLPRASAPAQLVIGVALLSIAGVAVAFLIGQWAPGLYVGRFFPNAFYLGAILIGWTATRAWPRLGRLGRSAIIAYAALFMLAGAASNPKLWLHRAPPRSTADIQALGQFLADHHLTYGYGPYWGSSALSMEWFTKGQVVIRPVTFAGGRIARRPGETSPYWYSPAGEPVGVADRFLVIANDGEQCPSVTDCAAAAIRQFGPPSRQLQMGETLVLVWPGSIAARIQG